MLVLEVKRQLEKFITWMKEYDPDIIHLHNLHGYYIHVGELFSYLKTCGKKILWTLHDCWAFTGHGAYFDTLECEKIGQCHHSSQKNDYPKSLIDFSSRNFKRKKKFVYRCSKLDTYYTIRVVGKFGKKFIFERISRNSYS